jgi:type III pantothenate kinase
MVTAHSEELGGRVKSGSYGGFSGLLARETKIIDEVNPDLTLIGLRLIYRMNRE